MKKITQIEKPLVSIIVNCLNGEKYLRQAIRSIVNQSYKNWEVIFWDNCSTDKSYKIIKSFKSRKIKYYKSQKITKLYEARNLAIRKAKGKFISFLDVDDLWLPKKLEKQINLFNRNKKLTLVYTNQYLLNDKTNKRSIYAKNILPSGLITQEILDNYKIGILTTLIKKDYFKSESFNKGKEIIGDFEFFVKLSLKKYIGSIQEPLACFRIHEKNISRNKTALFIKELEHWVKKNKNNKTIKKFNLNGVYLQIQILKIKNFIFKKEKIKAFIEILKLPLSIKKIKFISLLIMPLKIVKKIYS